MALFFNLKTLEEQSCNSSLQFLSMLEFHYNKKIPRSSRSKFKPSKVSLAGHSFLLNPQALFADATTDVLYKVQYVKLAAYRDWNLYKQYGYKNLHTSYFPDLNYNAIKTNPLLTITDTEIVFNYE